MTAKLISGTDLSKIIREELKSEVELLKSKNVHPGLAVVLVGDDPASEVYVGRKAKACDQLGIYSEVHKLPETTTEKELVLLIRKLNVHTDIHGILVQLPLPKHISEKAVIDAIAVEKDVDGFHPINVGNLLIGDDSLLPCTPAGVIEMIKREGIEIAGKHAVVIGRSNIVGKPVSMLLLRENATVSICHSKTSDIATIAKQADILIVATGIPKMIGPDCIKEGAVVIDVGINRMDNGKLCGDVDFDKVKDVAGYITPVPGGVGPMTITMLIKNTLEAASKSA
ncbi:bifunctional methylenetetrahydrofolate dehydrogenase/methenyltetrahydrofolate cyclohydrolase FolD [Chengkuizengella sediminis]|uniref:bifunctional methylenetetrahydrofolate dehydrogenase/methenyltetrahydrofolate cyclohydrolase FolD n=1 Tax=Chengkuizengella sediminis TaxID=1885917 RepID=UPI00138A49EA|nr:bifunctional methylenetetrahydrofolate dehydrogenase/methenyltetrahydrofolate cyclohydrolase FolD [Chengkuizengella sediminis]NDI34226.1 bifunctional methylenetetrahydrofolate dehydrogenase/methenyltetrahydrofolate cyclohydrolase FolD [Chengkuizengella sediminis]